jgi:hypothetical protein
MPNNKPRILRHRALFLLLPLLATSSSLACPCGEKPGLKTSHDSSTLTFVGRILEQKSSPFKPGYTEVKITVLQRYKDSSKMALETATVYTPDNAEKCGYSFQPGFEYLIFANGNPAFYTTTSCSRTEVLDKAQTDLKQLNNLSSQPLNDKEVDKKAEEKNKKEKPKVAKPRNEFEEEMFRRRSGSLN